MSGPRARLERYGRPIILTIGEKGTSPAVTGTPEEEVGYIASEEYTSRLASPPPNAGLRQDSQPAVESPLRKASFPAAELERTRSAQSVASSDAGSHVIHVDDPYHHSHRPDGFAQTPDHASQGPAEGDAEHDDEPILAADEVRPESAFLHPAISPTFEHHDLERTRSRTPSAAGSRPASRPSSLHGAPAGLARWNSRGEEYEETHTPLEDVEEYEPLFPEDEKSEKPVSTAERFRNRVEQHRFPSQDIWEDTPDSLQLHASVSTPEPPKEESKSTFETPEAEEARRKQTEQVDSHQVASHILESNGEAHEEQPSQPDTVKQRFPSRDIWEDAPESQKLVTTIEPADTEVKSPPDASTKPTIPPRPSVPIRPQRPAKTDVSSKNASPEEKSSSPTEVRKAPAIPDRPRPQVPARPAKPVTRESTENTTAPPATKPKPTIPARPSGGIAGVKANFLSDLNSRLQLGPQGPKPAEKKEEPEAPAEKGPLSDARKGRARGPPRRKPAAAAQTKLPSIPEIRIMDAWNVWQVDADGNLVVGPTRTAKVEEKAVESADTSETAVSEAPKAQESISVATGESTQADETTSAKVEDAVQAESEAAVEPDEPAAKPEDKDSAPSHETVSEDVEREAASADGKESDGDKHAEI